MEKRFDAHALATDCPDCFGLRASCLVRGVAWHIWRQHTQARRRRPATSVHEESEIESEEAP